jgi:hypothetical protein
VRSLRPFFCYYGGKWRDTPRLYPAPEHRTIVEPFAGAAGYSLRYPDRDVVLCEIDPILASLWRYLTRVTAAEILAIPDVANDQTVDDLNICQEARWLVGFWLNKGAPGPRRSPSAWMRSGIRPGSYWGPEVRSILAKQVEHIRHWQIRHGDYREVSPLGRATWFIDPPYQLAGQHYRHGAAGIDFPALGQWCLAREGQVIVCENEGADWLPFSTCAGSKQTPGANRPGRRREAVWLASNETAGASL